jgi:hypothetical protein
VICNRTFHYGSYCTYLDLFKFLRSFCNKSTNLPANITVDTYGEQCNNRDTRIFEFDFVKHCEWSGTHGSNDLGDPIPSPFQIFVHKEKKHLFQGTFLVSHSLYLDLSSSIDLHLYLHSLWRCSNRLSTHTTSLGKRIRSYTNLIKQRKCLYMSKPTFSTCNIQYWSLIFLILSLEGKIYPSPSMLVPYGNKPKMLKKNLTQNCTTKVL